MEPSTRKQARRIARSARQVDAIAKIAQTLAPCRPAVSVLAYLHREAERAHRDEDRLTNLGRRLRRS